MTRDSYRSFSQDLEDLAANWSNAVASKEQWQDLGAFGASESKPFRVSNGSLVGLAKPGERKTDGIARAAHEKIVSDLAFTLKLPVPPVILWDRGEKTAAERFVCISAWAFSPAFAWEQGSRTLTEAQKREALEVVSAMLAFEAWISAQDRKSDHLLINVASNGTLQMAFIDYAYSLSMSWSAPDAAVGAPGGYVPVGRQDASARAMADRILRTPEEVIKTIVERVPPDYLSDDKRTNITANLLSRRTKLHGMLGV